MRSTADVDDSNIRGKGGGQREKEGNKKRILRERKRGRNVFYSMLYNVRFVTFCVCVCLFARVCVCVSACLCVHMYVCAFLRVCVYVHGCESKLHSGEIQICFHSYGLATGDKATPPTFSYKLQPHIISAAAVVSS